jgi:hypothetical protein
MRDDSEPPWLIMEDRIEEDSPEEASQPMQITKTPLEATAALSRFRAIRSNPSDLKHLLDCRADPNMPVQTGYITPLQNILCFAREQHVVEMRNLLLQYEANENDEDRARWVLRQQTDIDERRRINRYNDIDPAYDPCYGNMEW